MSALLFSAGLFNLVFAAFHLLFWRLFRWPDELSRLGFANRGIMQVLNLCLTYMFVLMGGVFLLYPAQLQGTDLGRWLLLGMTGFWLVRLIYQPMFFGLRHRPSIVLFAVFSVGVLLHAAAWGAAMRYLTIGWSGP
jgi:hypothetical protein